MAVAAGAAYRLGAWVRSAPGAGAAGAARFTLESADRSAVYASFEAPGRAPGAWTRVQATLVAGASDANSTARLCVGFGAASADTSAFDAASELDAALDALAAGAALDAAVEALDAQADAVDGDKARELLGEILGFEDVLGHTRRAPLCGAI